GGVALSHAASLLCLANSAGAVSASAAVHSSPGAGWDARVRQTMQTMRELAVGEIHLEFHPAPGEYSTVAEAITSPAEFARHRMEASWLKSMPTKRAAPGWMPSTSAGLPRPPGARCEVTVMMP